MDQPLSLDEIAQQLASLAEELRALAEKPVFDIADVANDHNPAKSDEPELAR